MWSATSRLFRSDIGKCVLPRIPTVDLPPVLEDAFYGLPARYRTALWLKVVEGHTHEEVARRMGCAAGTVKSLVSRGLTRLRPAHDIAEIA